MSLLDVVVPWIEVPACLALAVLCARGALSALLAVVARATRN